MLLRRRGYEAIVFERNEKAGGLIRSERMHALIYEPHGTHVFHTDDEEVWRIVTDLIPFNDYEHRVQTVIEGKRVRWPIMREDLESLSFGARALEFLDSRGENAPSPQDSDFESWCLRLMGPDLYEHFVRPYTEKQWGRPPSQLSADFAPKRVIVRTDGDDRLFDDRFQGFPDGAAGFGYAELIERMLENAELRTTTLVSLESLLAALARTGRSGEPQLVVITAPLDEFAGFALGKLEWRGLRFEHTFVPDADLEQERMVVNWPGLEYDWIRTHETKHGSRQQSTGTVLTREFTGAPTRYYPVPDASSANRHLNDRYADLVREAIEERGVRVAYVGRLARFAYLDQDEVIRQALDTVNALS
jgi:UDP-galactopyranose mutase